MTLEQYTIYDLGFNRFLTKQDNNLGIPSSMKSEMLNSNNPLALASGEIAQNLTIIDGFLQSGNFVTGSAGWRIDADGNLEANSGTFRGALSGNSLAIGTNGIHIDTNGNMWWGNYATYALALIKISSAGSVLFTTGSFSGDITGGTITIGSNAWKVDSSGNMWWGNYATYALALDKISGSGIWSRVRVNSSIAGVGYYYENSGDVNNVAFDIITSDGSTTNTGNLPMIRMVHGGTNVLIDGTMVGSGGGIKLLRTVGSGAGYDIHLYNAISTGNTFIYIQKNGNGNTLGMDIEQTISANSESVHNRGIRFTLATGGTSSKNYAFSFQGSEKVNASVGGTQDYKIRIEIGSTEYFIPCYTS